jgi:HlyD family secretion protein
MIKKILNFVLSHKITSGVLVGVLVFGGYYSYKSIKDNNQPTLYALATVEKGTIVTSISGSGQVSALNQVDVKSRVSGDVVYVGVKNGQEVGAGYLLVQLDTRDAQKAVRDAQINLENAQISLSKLQVSQISDTPKLQDAVINAQNNLDQTYQNGFNEVANSFLDLPNILTGIRGILYDSTVGTRGQSNTGAYQDLMDQYDQSRFIIMINQAISNYVDTSTKYDKNLADYKTTTRNSSLEQIVSLVTETLETAKTMSQAVKDEQNILDAVVLSLKQYQSSRPTPQSVTQYQADIASYVNKLNGHITSLTNIQNSITQSLATSQRALETSKQFNPLDLASQQNATKQKEASLQDAKDNLADYYIRAPFAGIVGKINMKKGDSASGGTAVANMLTKQKIAEISLNEVDVSKVKVRQKATLTFDAVGSLTITGEVLEIDSSGTVSQGVVTYNVKIGFDTQDERIKPGMSVSAAIITNIKQNVLLVPNSAIKSTGGVSYIEMPSNIPLARQLMANVAVSAGVALNTPPNRQEIEYGLINDSETEIINGVNEGDLVVIRTIITSTTSTSATQTKSLFPTSGARNGGGATRVPSR